MTDDEFSQFARRLFVEYPSLAEWLNKNSPDSGETQRAWRERLRSYSLAECMGVLDDWATGRAHPFAAYERDQVPMIVRSVIDKKRDSEAKRSEQVKRRTAYSNVRRQNKREAERLQPALDSEMRSAVDECVPIHKQFLDGEITKLEYVERRDAILEKHGITSEKTHREWVP